MSIHWTSTGTVIGDLRQTGSGMIRTGPDAVTRHHAWMRSSFGPSKGWSKATTEMAILEQLFASEWVRTGGVVYDLTHDIAALFSMTSSPPLDWSRSPHNHFVVKVPRALLPVKDTAVQSDETYILASSGSALVVADCDTTAECVIAWDGHVADPEKIDSPLSYPAGFHKPTGPTSRIATRLLANLISYIVEYRERVTPQGRSTKRAQSTFIVRPPVDAVITREFREAAYATVASGSLVAVRRALAHVVRGHWRNQAVGPQRGQRRMTWIRPHKRGEESLGSVVSRIERVC